MTVLYTTYLEFQYFSNICFFQNSSSCFDLSTWRAQTPRRKFTFIKYSHSFWVRYKAKVQATLLSLPRDVSEVMVLWSKGVSERERGKNNPQGKKFPNQQTNIKLYWTTVCLHVNLCGNSFNSCSKIRNCLNWVIITNIQIRNEEDIKNDELLLGNLTRMAWVCDVNDTGCSLSQMPSNLHVHTLLILLLHPFTEGFPLLLSFTLNPP